MVLLPHWAQSQATELQLYSKKGIFQDVRFELENAIVGRGLVVDLNGHVSEMLQRTGDDVGSSKPVYKNAEYLAFCSAQLSRSAMEADPANLGVCPYVIFIYETAAAPGIVNVGYRRAVAGNSAQSKTALEKIEPLLDSIAKDAVK